jgi:tripartite-type tricarboxylate transporter receptor subunit TctC
VTPLRLYGDGTIAGDGVTSPALVTGFVTSSLRHLVTGICAGLLLGAGASVPAQTFPSKPIRIVVPFPPGGSNDIVARALAPPLTKALGQNVIADNRPGGLTVVGAEIVARAPADGHTLLMVSFAFLANSALRSRLPYDTLKDFAAVAAVGFTPFMIAVHPSLPVKNVKDLIALARARPGELTYTSPGAGSGQHLTGEMLKLMAKVDILHVPYQGGSPSTIAVLGGHASILISTAATIVPHLATGRLRGLAVTSRMRFDEVKDVPTLAESGLPDFELVAILGLLAPAATPKPIIDRLSGEITRAAQLSEVRESLLKQGILPAPLGPAEFDAYIRAELQKIQKIVRDSNIKLE